MTSIGDLLNERDRIDRAIAELKNAQPERPAWIDDAMAKLLALGFSVHPAVYPTSPPTWGIRAIKSVVSTLMVVKVDAIAMKEEEVGPILDTCKKVQEAL
jgi:hypothetical protein